MCLCGEGFGVFLGEGSIRSCEKSGCLYLYVRGVKVLEGFSLSDGFLEGFFSTLSASRFRSANRDLAPIAPAMLSKSKLALSHVPQREIGWTPQQVDGEVI